jgi:FtsP/CotA-like multicopper oxidase with cupredoxin domain
VVPVHTYDGLRTVMGGTGERRVVAEPGATVRLRVVNTDNGPLRTWVTGSAWRLLAVDGRDVNEPNEVRDRTLVVPAGGRADVAVTVPADGAVRLDIGGDTAVLVGPDGSRRAATTEPKAVLDMLTYGRPEALPFDATQPTRRFDFRIGRRVGFVDGRPGYWWSINGHLFPDVPMFMVTEGDVVQMTVKNSSGDVHPMHLHGHHAVVLSRNGTRATGSPWWVDSLEVANHETYVIAFVADNPGVWMDHCHNLQHADQGLIAHLAYTGVTEPFRVGTEHGSAHNQPE